MKLISLCAKLHIPVIYSKHAFPETGITDRYIDEKQTMVHVQYLAEKKIKPFLGSACNLLELFGKRFNLALSISGTSVTLLERYAPTVIDKIKSLAKKGTVEFMSQPWSNSILPYFVQNDMKHQTELHRKTINTIFAQQPVVFMADLPLNDGVYTEYEPFPGCRTILTCSNNLSKNRRGKTQAPAQKTQFLINHTLSQKLQQVSSDDFQATDSNLITPVKRYLRKHASFVKPLILCFDPLAKNISAYRKWEEAIAKLLNKTQVSFYSLSDLEEISNYFSVENDYSENMLSQFWFPDYLLKNKMQQEAFNQFQNIYKTLITNKYPYLLEAWDFLQDLDNFLYMSDSFFLNDFASQHFTSFRSPHEAFTSYMNAAASFWIVSLKRPKPNIKKSFWISPANN